MTQTQKTFIAPSVMAQAADVLSQMTLAEKIGQMTQVEKNSITPDEVTAYAIGSVLSGGGGVPTPNTAVSWRDMVNAFQQAALETRLGIPLIYGVDAVHGHNNVYGATIFPHNIGLGATRNANLVQRIGRATALEMAATGARWNFAPSVAIAQDVRWGRTYESYSQETAVVTELGAAYVRGLHGAGLDRDETAVLPSVKHFIADGGTRWGTSTRIDRSETASLTQDATLASAMVSDVRAYLEMGAWQIDQGVSDIDEATLRAVHLPPYIAAIAAGALNVMVSYSSWGGLRMHAQRYLLTDVLKSELGFRGFLVSDWQAIDQINPADFYDSVVQAVNAGLDMIMVPFDFRRFIRTLRQAVENGDVPISRIDDAVDRILRAKLALGLAQRPFPNDELLTHVGSDAHRALAREAVRQSAVLLKNEDDLLPLPKTLPRLLVAGAAADDVGLQCGGWTISWMGQPGPITPGTTILDGIRTAVSPQTEVVYAANGRFDTQADVGIVVLAETPYAEGMGDRADLSLTANEKALINNARSACQRLIVIMLSGRPRIVTEQLPAWDAVIAAWLPGTEGHGLTDVIFGDAPFVGTLPVSWPRSMDQIPLSRLDGHPALWPIGHGLTT